ncbi:MAG: hypothetical protein WBB45_20070 [Cyclobacteriaceae bacterium]
MRTLFMLTLLSGLFSCVKDDDVDTIPPATCSTADVVISEDKFLNAPGDPLTIQSVDITEDCIEITFSAGGCDGSSWEVRLIDSEAIIETLPVTRDLRLSLKDDESCEALLFKTVSFDLTPIRYQEGPVRIHLKNHNEYILYTY